MGTGQWIWSKIAPVMPNSLVMNAQTIKIDLKTMENPQNLNLQETIVTDLINEMKQSGFLQKTKLKDLPPKLEQLYMSQMSKKDVDYPLASSITKN